MGDDGLGWEADDPFPGIDPSPHPVNEGDNHADAIGYSAGIAAQSFDDCRFALGHQHHCLSDECCYHQDDNGNEN